MIKGLQTPLATHLILQNEDELTVAKAKQTVIQQTILHTESFEKQSEMIQVQKALKETTVKLDALKVTPDQTPAATTKLEIATQKL